MQDTKEIQQLKKQIKFYEESGSKNPKILNGIEFLKKVLKKREEELKICCECEDISEEDVFNNALNIIKKSDTIITLNQYQEAAMRTAPEFVSQEEDIKHGIYGLITELGEFANIIKRKDFYKKSVDYINLKEEIFDCAWYICLICRGLGITLEEGANINIKKLKKRFPDKFTIEKALNRDLDGERKILEGKE